MKKYFSSLILVAITSVTYAQKIDKIIKEKEVIRIEKALSADDMEGRGLYSRGLDKAADFIADEFKKAGILVPDGQTNFFQEFSLLSVKQKGVAGKINQKSITAQQVVALTTQPTLHVTQQSDYEQDQIDASDGLMNKAFAFYRSNKNTIVWVHPSHGTAFAGLTRFKRDGFAREGNIIFVLKSDNEPVEDYSIAIENELIQKSLKNVVGILPGKSRPDEIVIFSGHYDHLGIGKPNEAGDSIYNGANDDAAGITGVIMLARYFAKLKNNERTIVFSAFTAEETGGYGSQYFSKQFDAEKVVAMCNIEMIGTDSKWGINNAYITGYEKSSLGEILSKNLKGTNFKFHPDPYTEQQLFYRSDNATLARLGVPAHTISTSKMDNEPYYHTVDDEFETLDTKNMTEIIKAIALSTTTIINGTDTPTRVDVSTLSR